jgi:maltose-binding protein MalE
VGPFSILRIIRPLDEFLPPEFFDRFVEGALDELSGHVWAVPDQVGNHLALLYNKRLVPDPPTTFDELVEIALRTTRDTDGDGRSDQYGLVLQLEEPYWMVPFLTAYGGWVMDEQARPTLDTPATVKALAFLKKLKDEHEVVPRESDYQLMDTLFKQGKAAMIVNGAWSFREYIDAGIELGIARIPRVEKDGRWAAPMIGSKGYSVNAALDPAKKTLVLELLDHLTSVEVTAKYASELGILPSVAATYEIAEIKNDPVLLASRHQWEVGTRMPVVPEMRVIWDAMRPNMQSVMNGTKTPERAARDMQGEAIQKIAAMKRQ